MVQRANRWIQRNIFYVTAIFAMLLSVTIGAVFYGIHLGTSERQTIRERTEQSLHNQDTLKDRIKHDSILKNVQELRELINK